MKGYLVLFAFCGLLTWSCQKKGGRMTSICNSPCPYFAIAFKFRIINKQTGQDYFFSNPPEYPVSALHVRTAGDTANTLFFTDSLARFFFLVPPQELGSYIYFIQIGNLMPDTVQLGLVPHQSNTTSYSCCAPSFSLGYILLNGRSQATSTGLADTSALEIKD